MKFNVVAGTEVTVTTVLTFEDGSTFDPQDVRLRWASPATTGEDASPVRTSEGHYEATVTLDVAGEWAFEWVCTDPDLVTLPYYIGVLPSVV